MTNSVVAIRHGKQTYHKSISWDDVRGPLTDDQLGVVDQLLRLALLPIAASHASHITATQFLRLTYVFKNMADQMIQGDHSG